MKPRRHGAKTPLHKSLRTLRTSQKKNEIKTFQFFSGQISSLHLTKGDADILSNKIVKRIFSKRFSCSLTISNDERVNLRAKLNSISNSFPSFDYRYFFYSSISKTRDWLTAISGKPVQGSPKNRRTPIMEDWAQVFYAIRDSPKTPFVIILDNAVNAPALNLKWQFMKKLKQNNRHLKRKLKFIIVKRVESKKATT